MKVLIISHNPVSTYQNMGKTFVSLFSKFDKKELCQLYIYPTIPDIDVCDSYYRITDKDILKSYWNFGKTASREIISSEIDTTKHEKFENKKDEKLYNRKKNYFTILIRDILWKCARYYNNSLVNWLNREKPTCIFLAPGEAKFIYDLAMKISNEYNIPIITYICDEFYFVNSPKKILGKIYLFLLQKKIEKLMKKTKAIVTICDELNRQYSEKFSKSALTIMTGSNYTISKLIKDNSDVCSITYLGNLAYKRDESIIEIGQVLDKIKNKYKIDCLLKLYTGKLDEKIVERIKKVKSIKYCGYVTGKEFEEAFYDSQILLHIESFDLNCIDRVKNSISTKIADSLGSGIPLLAYGPENIASISYLKKNKCAYVITNKKQLEDKLKTLLSDNEIRKKIAKHGLDVAEKNHQSDKNSIHLYDYIKKIIEKRKNNEVHNTKK